FVNAGIARLPPCLPNTGFADHLMRPMVKLIDELRRGWRGTSRPSLPFALSFAASCLTLATAARWLLSMIRSDVFFTPYIPAVFFATALGGYRIGIGTAGLSALLGLMLNFGEPPSDFTKLVLMTIFLIVCGLTIWGVEHYRLLASKQREISRRL